MLDEPTNHLDAFSREELENTLLDYSGTMLIVSHDRYFINKLSTRILELKPDGVKEYIGDYDRYMEKQAEQIPDKTSVEAAEKPRKNDYKMRKEQQAKLRKARTRLKKCEEEIEQTEEEIADIESKLTSAGYEELMELTALLDEKTTHRDALYEEWESLSEQLTDSEQ